MSIEHGRNRPQEDRRPRKPSGPPPRTGGRIWTAENVRRAVKCTTDAEREALAREIGTSVDAVRQIDSRWRAAHGKTRPRHIWTDEEKRTVASLVGRRAVAEYARRIGVTEQSALSQRAKVRSEDAGRPRNHRWTRTEIANVRSLESSAEARRWARRRGLSEHTALNHWKRGRAEGAGK